MNLEITAEQYVVVIIALKDSLAKSLVKIDEIWHSEDTCLLTVYFCSGKFEDLLDKTELILDTFKAVVKTDKQVERRKPVLAELEQNLTVLKDMRKEYEKIMSDDEEEEADSE